VKVASIGLGLLAIFIVKNISGVNAYLSKFKGKKG